MNRKDQRNALTFVNFYGTTRKKSEKHLLRMDLKDEEGETFLDRANHLKNRNSAKDFGRIEVCESFKEAKPE